MHSLASQTSSIQLAGDPDVPLGDAYATLLQSLSKCRYS